MAKNLVRREPWDLFDWVGPDMNRFFGRHFLRRMFADEDLPVGTAEWMPAVDVEDKTDKVVVRADVPGVKPEDIQVTLENGVLTLSGERKSETEEKGKEFTRVERTYGKFFRSFTLPQGADPDKISATTKEGVLEVIVPKSPKAQARQIPVKNAA